MAAGLPEPASGELGCAAGGRGDKGVHPLHQHGGQDHHREVFRPFKL